MATSCNDTTEFPILNKTSPENDVYDGDEDDGLVPEASSIELKLTPEFCGIRIDKVVSQLVPEYSRSRLQQWIEAGHVTVDGQPAKAKALALGDETIVIRPQSAPEDTAFSPEPIPLGILYEDNAILVIDKPAGLVVHPAAGNWSGTLLNGLLHHFPAIASVPRAGIVHRLDKETSGLMVVGKTLQAQTDLVRQLQSRSVHREYLALVWGAPQISGRVDAAIGRHPRDRIKMAVSENASAKPAVTHYERIATGSLDGRPVSLLKCRLETGRTHQIRVHMQSIGFTLVGDPLYGKPHLAAVFPRQALHAYRLGLVHPSSQKECDWTSPLPDDMRDLLARAGIDAAAAVSE
ncbi:RluA family pseudouridine synthase [Noviherbaspirillum aerium]|uniref:RluA family pseudouridine synthase n=1 Tax=Noviherbaspirillum aerium TaxID=2588497 RepID=UPI00124DA423|nr:RluA family pseudouridine synthase [Noviherbaspirillum aerium]